MNIIKGLCCLLMLFGLVFTATTAQATQSERSKSTVLLVINNIAHSKHDAKLNAIMDEELHKKINGVYKEEASELLKWQFLGRDCSHLNENQVAAKLAKSKADFLIYAQLNGLNKKTKYNVIYRGKKVAASFFIRLFDIKKGKDIYSTEYKLIAEDTTDHFFVGSGSVSRMALRKVMFRAGEVISTRLPL